MAKPERRRNAGRRMSERDHAMHVAVRSESVRYTDDQAGRHVGAISEVETSFSMFSVFVNVDDTYTGERKLGGLTLADASALVTCLQEVIAESSAATQFVRNDHEVPSARDLRVTA